MCVRNINANIFLCEKLDRNDDGTFTMRKIFDCLNCSTNEDGNMVVSDFSVIISFNALGSSIDSPFAKEFDSRLTLVNRNTGKALKLADYTYNPSKTVVAANGIGQCKDCASLRLIVTVNSFIIEEGAGEYLVKLWLKEKSENEWCLQSMTTLFIDEEEKESK